MGTEELTMSAPLAADQRNYVYRREGCECEVLHVGPICDRFDDDDTGICMRCEHEEACHADKL